MALRDGVDCDRKILARPRLRHGFLWHDFASSEQPGLCNALPQGDALMMEGLREDGKR